MPRTVDWSTKKAAWVQVVTELCDEIEGWAKQRKWTVVRQDKHLHEDHIGSYAVPFLSIRTPEATIHVDPVGRNIIGAEGRVDILSFPSLNRMLLVRKGDHWSIKTDSLVDWPRPWSRKAFVELVQALATAA